MRLFSLESIAGWFKGLIAAVIGGCAAAVNGWLLAGMDLSQPDMLKRLGIMALIQAIVVAVAYCMKSPFPED